MGGHSAMKEMWKLILRNPPLLYVPAVGLVLALLLLRIRNRYVNDGVFSLRRSPPSPADHRASSTIEVPISEACSRLAELADDVVAGREKFLTKDGARYVAIVDARKVDYYHALEVEHSRLVLLKDAENGLEDVLSGRVQTEEDSRNQRRSK